jgi:hypothetical protein
MLCILSPILLIVGASAGAAGLIPLTEDQASILGCIILMLIVAAAVFLFVKNGMQLSKYDYLENELRNQSGTAGSDMRGVENGRRIKYQAGWDCISDRES